MLLVIIGRRCTHRRSRNASKSRRLLIPLAAAAAALAAEAAVATIDVGELASPTACRRHPLFHGRQAARSLATVLIPGPPSPSLSFSPNKPTWQVGDLCRAIWTEDGVVYRGQIDEIDRIQKRVTTGEVTPLNINLPRDGVFLAFSQPLQTETDKPMTISFTVENTRRTSWWIVLMWSSLGITVLFSLILAVRRFALCKPALSEG